jgi:hypothetical protein
MKQNINVQSGNRIIILMDGIQLGYMQSVNANDDYGPEPASGIGDIHALEYVPSMARHNLSVSQLVLKKGNMRAAGISMENGDAVLKGLVFDIEYYDKDNTTLLRKYIGCSYASGSMDVQKHAIVMANATFNALDVQGTGA